MSKSASEFQEKAMALLYRGKEIFKPLNTEWIDNHVACVREHIDMAVPAPKQQITYSVPQLQGGRNMSFSQNTCKEEASA